MHISNISHLFSASVGRKFERRQEGGDAHIQRLGTTFALEFGAEPGTNLFQLTANIGKIETRLRWDAYSNGFAPSGLCAPARSCLDRL